MNIKKCLLVIFLFIFPFILYFGLINIFDIKKPESQPVPQINQITFGGQNLLPFDTKAYETKLYESISFLGGTWYLVSIDCSKINSPLDLVEKKYLGQNWEKRTFVNGRSRWQFPLRTPQLDDANDLLFHTNKTNGKFGVNVRVSHSPKSQELFFYITLPK